MTASLSDLTARLLDAAKRAGAEAADALAVHGTSTTIDVRQGKLEQAERAEGTDIGLRVLIGGRQACVSASDISDRTITALAERAVAMAREAPEDPTAGLADPSQLARGWDLAAFDLCDPAPEPDAAALEQDCRAVEAAALSRKGITQVEASAGYSARAMHLAASNGFAGGYARTSRSLSAVAFTGQGTGMERDWAGESRTYQSDLPAADGIGTLAADRALSRAGATKPVTGNYPVLFDERIASSLIGHLLSAINGTSIARGSSWLRDALGQQVLPAGLSVIEDPHRPRISSSRPFDGEGLPTQRRAIVQDGILTGWVLDLATARKLGMTSTANAARGTSHPPSPSTSNIDLTPGTRSRDDLIRDMGTGLLVTSMIGSTINPTTGDYSRGAAGFWVENGTVTHPVNECTIAGNLRDMLLRLIPANDARAHLSTRVPSCLIDGLTLAGA
ncbi:TldD/PmbA family protein [Rhodobacteraceae bacterium HSP-20]|uniref:TldD/PmbA family protein n=1 Tax=Paragemmobacter amnigenus TaxID=2852097 RepID=A0ABS6J2M5_9RHOB|nr:TldD/PmbA family protein [Rhodobacter amnigenus]MBU9697777.1 TldD/PmbA family protein [Rhodobacter amnigenus]MBV4389004.1 TldD/PmbA family protein [Rhodobacter amnigenus]